MDLSNKETILEDFLRKLEIAKNEQFEPNVEDSGFMPMPIVSSSEPYPTAPESKKFKINRSEIDQKEPASIRDRFKQAKSPEYMSNSSPWTTSWKIPFINPSVSHMFNRDASRDSSSEEDKQIEVPSSPPHHGDDDAVIFPPSSRLAQIEKIKMEAALKREEKARIREAKRQEKMLKKEQKNKDREMLRLAREKEREKLTQEKQRLQEEKIRLKAEKLRIKMAGKKMMSQEMERNQEPPSEKPRLRDFAKAALDKFACRDRSSSSEKDVQNMNEEEQLAWAIKQSMKESKARPSTAMPRFRKEVPNPFYFQGLSEGLKSRAKHEKYLGGDDQNFSFGNDENDELDKVVASFSYFNKQAMERKNMFFNEFEEDKEEEVPNELINQDSSFKPKSSDQILLDQFKTKIGMERQYILFGELPPSGDIKSEDLTKKNNYIRNKLGLSGENRNIDMSLEKAFMLIDVLNMQTLFVYDPDFERFSCIDGSKVATNDTSHNSLTYFVTDDRECAICAEDYKKDDILMKLASCGHVFHAECCENYIYYNPECCYCRMKIC